MTADNAASIPAQVSSSNDDKSSSNTIAQVFENRSVLVTGASGFLGKVLVEKLLFSLPNIDKVYLLIRPSNHDSPKDRLQKMLQVFFTFKKFYKQQ